MEEKEVEVKILKVKTLAFSFVHKDSFEIGNYELTDFNYSSSIAFKANLDEETIDIKYDLKVHIKANSKEIVNLVVQSLYLFKNLKEYEISKNKLDIPKDIIDSLVETSISNTRGVLSVKINETGFENVILPMLSIDNFKKQKAKRELN